ncbi:MAG: molybdopterin-binding protein, partial [Selenomonadaceae bacterium]|nr:molybdopterin-binding protein [Selenomonadaceae bacterium]
EVDVERLDNLNDLEDIAIATLPQYMPVKAGTKLAGMRVIPLVIAKEKMEAVKAAAGSAPLLELHPYKPMNVGVVTTGSEVYNGLIEDTFTPVIEAKLKNFGLKMGEHRLSNDRMECTLEEIKALIDLGMDMVICTGGMSVDPDDRTPAAIKATGARIVTYGAPVLPGAMFLLSYYETPDKKIPILGLPGCVMYAATTIFDIVLPRLAAGIEVTRNDIRHLGAGGLCMNCKVCRYPNCGFGK